MSIHHFNIKVAEIYGINEAIILQNLSFWQAKNEANDKNFHDEKYWVYNSVKAFEQLFPYWSKGQINRILKKLEDAEALSVGNYNKVSYDRTKWYSLKQEIHLLISGNGVSVIEKPIPDSKPDSKPDNKNIQKEFEKFWGAYPKKVMKANALKAFTKIRESVEFDLIMKGMAISPQLKNPIKQYIPNAQAWINSGGWEDESIEDDIMIFAGYTLDQIKSAVERLKTDPNTEDTNIIMAAVGAGWKHE